MRTVRRVGAALLLALALSTSAFAQSLDRRISLDAAIGPSFANLGTTLSATADLNVALNERTSLVGEFGMLRHAPFDEAAAIAPPLASPTSQTPRVNGYHWNGNITFQPFESRFSTSVDAWRPSSRYRPDSPPRACCAWCVRGCSASSKAH